MHDGLGSRVTGHVGAGEWGRRSVGEGPPAVSGNALGEGRVRDEVGV